MNILIFRDNEAQARATAYIPVLWSEEIILEALGTPQRITKGDGSEGASTPKIFRFVSKYPAENVSDIFLLVLRPQGF